MKLLYNCQLVNEGQVTDGYLVIDGERIATISQGKPSELVLNQCDEKFDLQGDYVMPGAIDDHVHFRDPGLTHKADIATESRAAVAGGVTSFMDMPNTKPQTTTLDALDAKFERAETVSAANYSFYIGATNENLDVIAKTDFSKVCGVKAFLGSSTGNMLVNETEVLRRLFSETEAIIAVHAEEEAIIKANRERLINEYGEDLPLKFHPLLRSEEACYVSTAKAVELAQKCGTRLHVLHLSTEKELSLFEDKPLSQKKITAEACVHYLTWCDADYDIRGSRVKCNPAIKKASDRAALIAAVQNGKIDVVATDHAPHLLSEKEGNCLTATSGMPLIQFSLVAMLELVEKGCFSIATVAEKMSHAPAELFKIDSRGYLREGYYADIVVVHRNAEPKVITDADVVSRCAWTPFNGDAMHYEVKKTFVNGNLAYSNGIVLNGVHGKCLKFNN